MCKVQVYLISRKVPLCFVEGLEVVPVQYVDHVNEDEAGGEEYATPVIVGCDTARLPCGNVPCELATGVECGPALQKERRDD